MATHVRERTPDFTLPSGCQVWVDHDVPDEVRRAMEVVLATHAHHIPQWLHTFTIQWDVRDAKDVCSIVVNYQYRDAAMRVTAQWFALPQDQRDTYLVHELVHIVLAPMVVLQDRMAALLAKSHPGMKGFLQDTADDALEAVTVDLARAWRNTGGRPSGG